MLSLAPDDIARLREVLDEQSFAFGRLEEQPALVEVALALRHRHDGYDLLMNVDRIGVLVHCADLLWIELKGQPRDAAVLRARSQKFLARLAAQQVPELVHGS